MRAVDGAEVTELLAEGASGLADPATSNAPGDFVVIAPELETPWMLLMTRFDVRKFRRLFGRTDDRNYNHLLFSIARMTDRGLEFGSALLVFSIET
jgi:hypothetical protein